MLTLQIIKLEFSNVIGKPSLMLCFVSLFFPNYLDFF